MKNLLKNFIFIFSVIFLGFFINSCSDDLINSILNLLSGAVSSPGGQNLSSVDVILTDSKGSQSDFIATTKTNSAGQYSFSDVPPGPKKLYFGSGSFRDTIDVVIPESGNLNVETAIITASKKLGYFYGSRDSIQTFVSSFGYSVERLSGSQLQDTSFLKNYDIIFINSGDSARNELADAGPSLRKFMESGGSIYASDWAIGVVSGIPGIGLNEGSDGCFGGLGDSVFTANISDPELSADLNKSTAEVKYKAGGWYSMFSSVTAGSPFAKSIYGDGCTNFVSENRPVALKLSAGSLGGKLFYTSFRYESGQTADGLNILKFYLFGL